MCVTWIFLLLLIVCLLAFIFKSPILNVTVAPGMSNLVLAVCNEPRGLTVGRTISEIYRKELFECTVDVLCRNLFQGWFYACPSSTTAKVSFWAVGHGGSDVLLEIV
jgi:hypothetical protein